mgnify:CR=1 FL=1
MSAETNSILTAPLYPDSLASNHKDSRHIGLQWNKVKTATKYRIYVSETATSNYREIRSTTYLNITLSGLKSDTVYYFKVSAENSGGESELSKPISARTLPPPPTGVKVKALNTSSLLIQWDLLKGASSYNIYRVQETEYCKGEPAKCKYKIIASDWESTTYVDMDLEKDTIYFYKIHGVFRNSIEGVQSKEIKGRGKLSTPQSLRISNLTKNSVTLSWEPVEGAWSYSLYRDGQQLWNSWDTINCSQTRVSSGWRCLIRDNTYTDTNNLIEGNRYNYTVAAHSIFTSIGEGMKTEPLEVTIPQSKPY